MISNFYKQLHILTVDDDANARLLVTRQMKLTFAGARITEIGGDEEFHDALKYADLDLVITDYQLYWTDGLSILRDCKNRWPDCPVIMFTATGSEEIAVEGMKSGLDDYILKSPKHLDRLSAAAQLAVEKVAHRQALAEAEARYRRLFDSVPIGLYRATSEGQFLDVNSAMVRILGYPDKQTLLTTNMTELYIYSDDRESWLNLLSQGETGQDFETPFRRYDGKIIWIRKVAQAVWDDEETKLLYEGILEDITKRKQGEETLKENEQKFRAQFHAIPLATFTWQKQSQDFVLIEVNQTALTVTAGQAAQFVEKTAIEIYPDRPDILADLERCFTDREIIKRETMYQDRHSGNKEFIVYTMAFVPPDLVMMHVETITDYKLTKDGLEQRNRELTLLNQASQAFISTLELDEVLNSVLEEVKHSLKVIACSVWLIDPETNELVCRQVTDPQSDIVRGWRLPPGQGLGGWVVKQGQSLIVDDVQKSQQHFKGVDEQTGLPIRSILTVPLQTKKGIIGVLQMVDHIVSRFDTTDQRLGEALGAVAASAIENAQLYEQAQRDAETKAILIDEINHRVKNNLAAIIGLLYAERRHAGMENEATYQKIMKNLINRVQGLATVHSLLSASGWSSLRLSDLATQIIHAALQALLPDKQVLISVPPSPIRVLPKQAHSLAMVINELTTNTIKYALQEQDIVNIRVTITVETDTDSAAPLVFFEFRDDGPGYPEDVLSHKHQDVGLYMVQSIVQKDLRGSLTFKNDDGAVAIVCFKLMDTKG